jgi:uncharacterized ion transporter superfamily protein YfcC
MDQKAGAQIGKKAFLQSFAILFFLILAIGILTYVIQPGSFERAELDGRTSIVPGTYKPIERPDYPVWRWFTAPIEVLWAAENSLTIIVIILFILMLGAAFAILDKTGILQALIGALVRRFGGQKYRLLLIITLVYMLMGAFFGMFEEAVVTIPLMLALSYSLGWDALVGLGMSMLALNLGFSAAITNPFTIGIAQQIAGLPPFSGVWLRIPFFLIVYGVFALFITRYARKIEKNPQASLVYQEELEIRKRLTNQQVEQFANQAPGAKKAQTWLAGMLVLILLVLFAGPFIPAISAYALPLVGILFFITGLGAGFLSGRGAKLVWKAAGEGVTGILPGVPLILMAASIKYIADNGGITDTILNSTSTALDGVGPVSGVVLMFALTLLLELFIGSASAKVFLMMPIIYPLADLIGVTRQTAVSAYCFGDGFSNLAYPTNPVLLIVLGLTVVSYPKWMRWTWPLWVVILLLAVAFLALGVAIDYGPF